MIGRSRSFSTSAPTRCRLRPCRSMKVSSSDATERRSFGTFTRQSLPTDLSAQRSRETSARWTGPGRPRHLPATTPPSGADPDLRLEQSGGPGTDGGQAVLVPPPRTPTTPEATLTAEQRGARLARRCWPSGRHSCGFWREDTKETHCGHERTTTRIASKRSRRRGERHA
jgi:hypothetical protein